MPDKRVTDQDYRTIYEADGTLPVRLEVVDVEHPPGNKYLHHRLVVGDGRPAAVIAAQHDQSLLLVRIFRKSVGAELWELPRGSSDAEDIGIASSHSESKDEGAAIEYSDDTLTRAAMRELLEETGYVGQGGLLHE